MYGGLEPAINKGRSDIIQPTPASDGLWLAGVREGVYDNVHERESSVVIIYSKMRIALNGLSH